MLKKLILLSCFLISSCSHEITPNQLSKGPLNIDYNAKVSGKVELAEGVKLNGSGTLFIILRQENSTSRAPLAVKRIQDPVLPIGFQMSYKNVMIKSQAFQGPFVVSAKWTKDGNPTSLNSGDVLATKKQIAKIGDTNLKIQLDKVID